MSTILSHRLSIVHILVIWELFRTQVDLQSPPSKQENRHRPLDSQQPANPTDSGLPPWELRDCAVAGAGQRGDQ
jgi:hypothetical protein